MFVALSFLGFVVSVGMVCCDPTTPESIEELLAKADQAMYARKPGRKTK